MLDAYIIDRIRRERERARRQERAPLHIDPTPPHGGPARHGPPAEDRDEDKQERGSVVIDFCV